MSKADSIDLDALEILLNRVRWPGFGNLSFAELPMRHRQWQADEVECMVAIASNIDGLIAELKAARENIAMRQTVLERIDAELQRKPSEAWIEAARKVVEAARDSTKFSGNSVEQALLLALAAYEEATK